MNVPRLKKKEHAKFPTVENATRETIRLNKITILTIGSLCINSL